MAYLNFLGSGGLQLVSPSALGHGAVLPGPEGGRLGMEAFVMWARMGRMRRIPKLPVIDAAAVARR